MASPPFTCSLVSEGSPVWREGSVIVSRGHSNSGRASLSSGPTCRNLAGFPLRSRTVPVRAPSAQRTDLRPWCHVHPGEPFVMLEGVVRALIPRRAGRAIDFRQLDGRDLLTVWAGAITELRERALIRTAKA